ncbi:MAG: methionine--tRNA ligase [Bacteroidetes bacterium]|nr:MAG: methionine--tRNA ligase [Bacteroidota bacterium]TAG88841.1 MAG: methionine--tRNA ligase [Bacteroidota bacterium]
MRYTITAALLYANGPAHIGHLAGCYIPADIYARYLRAKNHDVLFVSGSDEHGVPITIRAEKEGLTPQQVVDKYHSIIKKSFEEFGISFDIYSRTSKKVHHTTSSDFFTTLNNKKQLLVQKSEQYFDDIRNKFLQDRYIVGECPKCNNPNAFGDQCEKCGSTLSPSELINPRSALSNATPILKETSHWYLPLQEAEKWLKEWILETHQSDWKTNVYGQCKSWLEQGLQARAVTRDLEWGVPVPLADTDGKVLYVWFEAPIGYISATKDYFEEKNEPVDNYKKYWQDENTKLIHFIGKDNIVFHCIIFPTMLKLHGDFILPTNVPANEFLNLEGNKISTSRNWAVWLHEYLVDFPEKQDVLRYVLTANAPEQKDNDFTWKDFQAKNNNELVATLGNFINRAFVLSEKYTDNKVPQLFDLEQIDKDLLQNLQEIPTKIENSIENYRFKEALNFYMELARIGNKYMQDTAPWQLAKDLEKNKNRIDTILHLSLQLVANLAILGEPFLPFTAKKINQLLNIDAQKWEKAGKIDILTPNHSIQKASLLFAKIEDIEIQKQIDKLENSKKQNELENYTPENIKKEINFDDFSKIDIRIGTIKTAEKVAKTKKLLKLSIDIGIETRTVVSGIAEHFLPENIIGQQVCLIANLAPRAMQGIESQGMILMAEDADGKLKFVAPNEIVKNGVTVK